MNKVRCCALFLGVALIGSAGCGAADVVTGGLKVANGQISQLTVGELKALNQIAIELIAGQTNTRLEPLNDEQAEAVVNFLKANDINTPEDIEALVAAAEADPSSIEGLSELAAAFAGSGTEIDPDNFNPDDLAELFQSVLGG